MATTIKLKNGSGAPLAGDLVQGEPALDLTNKRLYSEDSGGTVVEIGSNPSSLSINGTAITATATEINVLDGITSTTAELNILDGVTATATELNTLDGITATTAELNILDGVTSTAAELNFVDGSLAGTIVNSKAVIYGTAGEVNATTLQIAGTAITSTAAELNILDGVTATASELNVLDGITSTTAELNILAGKSFVDEDDMVSNSATGIPSQQSVKAYVDAQLTASDLDFQGDSGGALSIDLDSETLTIAGGAGIDTSGAINTLTVAIDSTVATLTGSQTLTNKTLTTPVISSISNTGTITLPTSTDTLVGRATTDTLTNKTLTSPVLNTGVSGTAVLDDDTFATASSTTLATSESIKAYVDAQSGGGGGIALTDLSVTTNSVGTAALSYNNTTGVFSYTPPDLSSYLTSLAINGISDVTITTPADNEVLAYDTTSSEFINQTASEAGLATSAQGSLADSALQPADLSVTTNAAGSAALTYTSGTGVFSYTPPDLSSYLTAETDPVVGAITGIVKADGAGNISAAVAGTDYLSSVTFSDIDAGAYLTSIETFSDVDTQLMTAAAIKDLIESYGYVFDGDTVASITLTSADINGGTIDNVTIGGTTAAAGTFTTFTSNGIDDNADATAITIDSSERVGIGETTLSRKIHVKSAQSIVGTIESTLANFPATLTFRDAGETIAEGVRIGAEDDSLILQTNGTTRLSINSSGSVAITSADINGGTIDGTNVGATTAGTGKFTTLNATGKTTFDADIEEQQYSLTGTAINPANGTIQYKTLGANTTFTESLTDGEFVTLMINDGAGYTITWPTTTWVGGSAPTLETTGYNVIELWHVNGTLYGAFVGAA
jgi:hypothetical protein